MVALSPSPGGASVGSEEAVGSAVAAAVASIVFPGVMFLQARNAARTVVCAMCLLETEDKVGIQKECGCPTGLGHHRGDEAKPCWSLTWPSPPSNEMKEGEQDPHTVHAHSEPHKVVCNMAATDPAEPGHFPGDIRAKRFQRAQDKVKHWANEVSRIFLVCFYTVILPVYALSLLFTALRSRLDACLEARSGKVNLLSAFFIILGWLAIWAGSWLAEMYMHGTVARYIVGALLSQNT